MNPNDIAVEGPFGDPFGFLSSDMRATLLIAQGIDRLNRASTESAEALQHVVAQQDPVVTMAVLARMAEAVNALLDDFEQVNLFLTAFGQSQAETFATLSQRLNDAVTQIRTTQEPVIEARIAAGFDTPWTPSTLTKEENTVADFFLRQVFGDTPESLH